MSKEPGRSYRTEAKHDILNVVAGRFVASAEYCARDLGVPARQLFLYDLAAGDAAPDPGRPWKYGSSPGILSHHARYPRCGVPVHLGMWETAPATYGRLVETMHEEMPALGYDKNGVGLWTCRDGAVTVEAAHGDGRGVPLERLGYGDYVLINNDPNHVKDWVMPVRWGRGANVLSLTSMGCNVGGLLRLDLVERELWVAHVSAVLGAVTQTQDALIIAIDGDGSRWGYLLVTAEAWWLRDERRVQKIYATYGFTLRTAWWGHQRGRFNGIGDYLMLTGEERDAGFHVDFEKGCIR
jgi:hypothetical protein